MMSSVSHQPLSMRPLGQNNSQQPSSLKAGPGKRAAKVTARADSTGAENTEGLVKHHHSVKKAQTASVVKRNLRERTRVQGVNQGFGKLKQYVPDLKSKSSKVETLRGAIDYIRRLKELLGEDVADLCTPVPKIELEDDDDSSSLSDLTDYSTPTPPAPAPAKAERSPEVSLNPLVYGLPYSDQPSSYPAPVLLPSLSSLSSLTPVHPEKLPSMSITATSWWPETTPRLGSSPLL